METLRSVGRTSESSKYCSVLRESFSQPQIFQKYLRNNEEETLQNLFFENCIEEGNERKIFHTKHFSDVPKEISRNKLAKKVKVCLT